MEHYTLAIHLSPASRRDAFAGWYEGATDQSGKALKIYLQAAPQDGKANKALIAFLAKNWGIPKASISLIAGETSRHKRIRISGEVYIKQVIAALPQTEDCPNP